MARTRDHAPSQRATIHQAAARAHYDQDILYPLIDAAIIGTVAIVQDGQPIAIPMAIARLEDHIYLHGSRTSRLMQHLAAGHELCISLTHLDGLVVARSGMHCSANYRSAVVHGRGQVVEDEVEKAQRLHDIVEALIPGSRGDFREHLPKELKATTLIAVSLAEAACKIRTGEPNDDKDDLDLPYWAGVIPIERQYGEPIPAADLSTAVATPAYALHYPQRA